MKTASEIYEKIGEICQCMFRDQDERIVSLLKQWELDIRNDEEEKVMLSNLIDGE